LGVDGSAAVELAITVSLLAVLMLGIADYGTLMNGSAALFAASRAGAEYAVANPTDTAGMQTQVTGYTTFSPALNTFDCKAGDSCVNPVCTCVDNTWPKGTACPPTGANPCAGVKNPYIAGTPVDPRVLQYVTITAAQKFTPLFTVKNFGVLPPTTFNFPANASGTTVARTE
jgi:Flp pilus assembly protein TadG